MNSACDSGIIPIHNRMLFTDSSNIFSPYLPASMCHPIYYYGQNVYEYYAWLQAMGTPNIVPVVYTMPPAFSYDSNFYSQNQCMVNNSQISDPYIYPKDNIGRYSLDGCWYPNSSPIKPNESQLWKPHTASFGFSVSSEAIICDGSRKEGMHQTSKIKIFKSLKAKLFSQEKIEKIYAKFHTPRLPSERPILLGQKPSKYSPGLEFVWSQQFNYLFSCFAEDVWSFGPCYNSSENMSDWVIFRDMAKVRFCCKKCKHGWTSMHGPVVFYYIYEEHTKKGYVRFILTGQKCIDCRSPEFETPMWYPEEAQKVMTNLYYEIAAKVYKRATPPLIKDRRHGRPRQQHIATDCQGCVLGICKPKLQNNNNNHNKCD